MMTCEANDVKATAPDIHGECCTCGRCEVEFYSRLEAESDADWARLMAEYPAGDDDDASELEPYEPTPADREWASETFGTEAGDDRDDDDHGVDLTPIDIDVLPPSALFTEAAGDMGTLYGHMA